MRLPHRVTRLAAVLVAATLLAMVPSAARAQSLSDLKEKEEAAHRAVDEAAAEVTAAIGEWNRIHHEIETTEANIAARRARADELSTLAVDRAVEAYKGSNLEVAEVLESDDLLEASRRARLLGQVTKQDSETITRLGVEVGDLSAEEEKLRQLRDEQQRVLDAKREAEERLEARLADVTAQRKKLEAKLAAEEAARRARASQISRSSPAPASPPVAVNGLVCPFPGSSFIDSWGAPRSGGRRHKGVDMMGSHGAPLYAVTGGSVRQRSGGLAGHAVWLHGDDGNLYFYAHLSSFGASGRVNRGDVVGYNGSTGNASGGAPHLHFEVKIGGSASVNPYPVVRPIC